MAIRARSIFAMMETEERQYAMIWSYAYEQVFTTDMSSQDNFEYLRRIMTGNQRPFILVDPDGKILESHDPEVDPRKTPVFEGEIKERYSQYPPLMVDAQGTIYQLYFKPSEVFLSLRSVFRDLDSSFVQETLTSTASVPVLITDESQEVVLAYSNLDPEVFYSKEAVHDLMHEMMEDRISIDLLASLYSTQLVSQGQRNLLDHNRNYYKLITRIVEEGQKRGEIQADLSVSEITGYYSMCERALVTDWCLNRGSYSLGEYSRKCMPIMLEHFKAN